jgi:hypothetical protein
MQKPRTNPATGSEFGVIDLTSKFALKFKNYYIKKTKTIIFSLNFLLHIPKTKNKPKNLRKIFKRVFFTYF